MPQTLHLALPEGENYGWGLCGKYLKKELAKLAQVSHLAEGQKGRVDGTLFYALEGNNLKPWTQARGEKNIGYVFFENELVAESKQHAQASDLIFGGSSWCCERLKEAGIAHCDVLIQGVDGELFYPEKNRAPKDKFVIFSGGKFEFRKGQDLVLKAFSILQRKYPEMELLTVWENQWEYSLRTMQASPLIQFELKGQTWKDQLEYICRINSVDVSRVKILPLTPQSQMRDIIAGTHLGVFPNRCEGGTNLVLMEYMACGKPSVISYTSGHKDIANEKNALLLKNLKPIEICDSQGKQMIRWEEITLEELIAAIEYAYHHRDETAQLGQQAAEDMKQWTWEIMAKRILTFC
ncbi:MAG: glycosyltransferase family 4 protein [Verrucomicrobiota bacterium]